MGKIKSDNNINPSTQIQIDDMALAGLDVGKSQFYQQRGSRNIVLQTQNTGSITKGSISMTSQNKNPNMIN